MTKIRLAKKEDMKAVLALITELAVYEKEPHAVRISEKDLIQHGFSESRFDCIVAEHSVEGVIGMALYYPRYSTWKGPTLHLEDLYVTVSPGTLFEKTVNVGQCVGRCPKLKRCVANEVEMVQSVNLLGRKELQKIVSCKCDKFTWNSVAEIRE